MRSCLLPARRRDRPRLLAVRMTEKLAKSGVPGLDYLIGGGFPPRHIYLVSGRTGSGKTTLGMQFALEGVRAGETTLYVGLAETSAEMSQIAASHGWSLEGITLFVPRTAEFDPDGESDYTLFHPGEVELTGLVTKIIDRIRADSPSRVVIDSVSEIRVLARDPLLLLRQMQKLRSALVESGCTGLLLENPHARGATSGTLETFAHGILELEYDSSRYGVSRRHVSVQKLRGVDCISGRHDFRLAPGGISVFPRLQATRDGPCEVEILGSGSEELDALCGGGLQSGSSTMIIGPAGTGKSTVAAQFALAAARRGQRSSLFVFDETEESCRSRWRSMNMPVGDYIDDGLIQVLPADPTELSPGEFCHKVRQSVEHDGSRLVIIDSLSGYMQVLPEPSFMEVHLFELIKYLDAKNVLSLLIVTQHGILGAALESPIDVSYLIDTILLLRFFEVEGEVHKAISVVKKRHGSHEPTIRECHLGDQGLRVGQPLRDFHGVLSGIPTFIGKERELIEQR